MPKSKLNKKKKIDVPECAIYLRHIPQWLRAEFKAACAIRGGSMRKVIIRFMKEYSGVYGPSYKFRTSERTKYNIKKKANI